MRFQITYPKKSIAVTRYGFKIDNTHITRIGNVIQAQVIWSANGRMGIGDKNDGYFLFKHPSHHPIISDRVIFRDFNKRHNGARFYLDFEFDDPNGGYVKVETIVHSLSKDGAFVSCILEEKSTTLVDDKNGREYFDFNIDGPDYKGQWVFERSSGYAGYRCKSCAKWVYEGEAMVCDCDLKG